MDFNLDELDGSSFLTQSSTNETSLEDVIKALDSDNFPVKLDDGTAAMKDKVRGQLKFSFSDLLSQGKLNLVKESKFCKEWTHDKDGDWIKGQVND